MAMDEDGRLQQPSLDQRIRAELTHTLTELGEAALRAFLGLPDVVNWHPKSIFLREVSLAFNVGLPFALLGKNPTSDAHRIAIGKAVAGGKQWPQSLWSEVQAAALVTSGEGEL